MPGKPKIYRVSDVAKLLAVPESTVWNWIQSGALYSRQIEGTKSKGQPQVVTDYWAIVRAIGGVNLSEVKNLWTTKQVGEWLQVSINVVPQYIRRGTLRAITLPHTEYEKRLTYRIPVHWLEAHFGREMRTMRRLLTVAQAEKILRLSYDTVLLKINSGIIDNITLPSSEEGKQSKPNKRIPLASLKAYMKTEDYRIAKENARRRR